MSIALSTESRAEQIVRLAQLEMTSEREGDIHILGLAGELDLANAADVEHELRRIEATDVGVMLALRIAGVAGLLPPAAYGGCVE